MVTIGEIFAEFADPDADDADDGDDGDDAYAGVLSGVHIRDDGPHRWQISRDRERRQRAWFRKVVKNDPSRFLASVKEDKANGPRATKMNEEVRAHEALDWITKTEADPKLEAARSVVRAFYKSGLSVRAFCKRRGIWPNGFNHQRRKYFKAIADRLTREWIAKTPISTKPTFGPGIAVGLDAIAKEFRCPVGEALAMINDPDAPVTLHSGCPIALRRREPQSFFYPEPICPSGWQLGSSEWRPHLPQQPPLLQATRDLAKRLIYGPNIVARLDAIAEEATALRQRERSCKKLAPFSFLPRRQTSQETAQIIAAALLSPPQNSFYVNFYRTLPIVLPN